MPLVLHLAWILITVLRFAGVIIVFGGVGLFGVYFIAGNAKAARLGDGTVPGSSWQGAGPRKGLRIIAVGTVMLLCAFALQMFLPDGT
jgi:hypothetical protein